MARKRMKRNPVAFTVQPRVVYIEEDLHSVSWCYQILIKNKTGEDLTIVDAATLVYDDTRLVLEEALGPREIARRAKPGDVAQLWFRPEEYVKPWRAVLRAAEALRWSDNFFVRPRGCGATAVVHKFVFAVRTGERIEAECRVPLKQNRQATRLRLPFDGWWQMFDGHEHYEHHMRYGGYMGMDFIGLCQGGAPYRGTGKRLSDWPCYGKEVKAPAAGTVVRVREGTPDSPPGLPRRDPVTGKKVISNRVWLDHGNDEGVMLAHFVPGTILVSEGDRVELGQPLGLCGNSGYSEFPHVHISLLRKEIEVPIIFSGYRVLRPIEQSPDQFSFVQTVEHGVIRRGEIVCHTEME